MLGSGGLVDCQQGISIGIEPVESRLERERKILLDRLADVEKAIAILKEQPQLLEALNVLRKVGI